VEAEFDTLMAKKLPFVNKESTKRKVLPVQPVTRKDWDAANSGDEGAATNKGFGQRD